MKLFSSDVVFLGGGKFSKQIKQNYLHNYANSSFLYKNKKIKVKENNISYYISDDYNNGAEKITPNLKNDYYIITIAEPNKKEQLEKKFLQNHFNCKKIELININSDIDNSTIKQGTIILNSIISFDCIINKNVFISAWCIIEPNVVIGDNCSIFARTTVTANCKIGNNTSIGTNCYINNNIKIGNNCSISPGSNVFEDIPDDYIFFQNKLIKRID
jgi:acetyltransferase-like isoleucine patch superfamily enzyme